MNSMADPVYEKKRWMNWALCMALFVVVESILFIYRTYNTPFYTDMVILQFAVPLTCAFTAIVLTQPSVRRYADVLLAEGYVLWYAVVLLINGHYFWLEFPQHINVLYRLVLAVAVCYPVAYALAAKGQLGVMRTVLAVLTLVLVAIAVLGIYRAVIRQPLVSPFNGATLGMRADGDGVLRLFPVVHANTGGAIFMMALILCVFLSLSSQYIWGKVFFAVAAVPVYVALALTNSRASMALGAFGLGLLGFLVVRARMVSAKPLLSWLVGALCALLLAGVCFAGYQGALWAVNQAAPMAAEQPVKTESAQPAQTPQAKQAEQAQQAKQTPQAEPAKKTTDPEAEIEQRKLLKGMGTLNGRTKIWAKVLQGIGEQPEVLLWGLTIERVEGFVSKLMENHPHPHSSYLQTLLFAGLPGLLLLLALLFGLVRFGLRLFLDVSKHTGLAQRFLPVVLLCSVLIALVEVMYFSGQAITDRLFFLVAGYVAVLARQLAEKKNEM